MIGGYKKDGLNWASRVINLRMCNALNQRIVNSVWKLEFIYVTNMSIYNDVYFVKSVLQNT